MLKSLIKMFPIYMYYLPFPPHELLKLFFFFNLPCSWIERTYLNTVCRLEKCWHILPAFSLFYAITTVSCAGAQHWVQGGPEHSWAVQTAAKWQQCKAGSETGLCSMCQLHNQPKSKYNSIGQTQFKINTLILILNKVRHAIVWWLICVPNYHDCMCKSSNYRSK